MRTTSMAVITAAGASLCCTSPILLAGIGADSLAAEKGMLACRVKFEDEVMDCRIDGEQLDVAAIPELVERLGYRARLAPDISTIVN